MKLHKQYIVVSIHMENSLEDIIKKYLTSSHTSIISDSALGFERSDCIKSRVLLGILPMQNSFSGLFVCSEVVSGVSFYP
jgi:hypothetical protein